MIVEQQDCKIEVAVALKSHHNEGNPRILSFKRGEKILIDRSVQGSGNYVFGRIGLREGLFDASNPELVRIDEY